VLESKKNQKNKSNWDYLVALPQKGTVIALNNSGQVLSGTPKLPKDYTARRTMSAVGATRESREHYVAGGLSCAQIPRDTSELRRHPVCMWG
jgi:hypothetical protein